MSSSKSGRASRYWSVARAKTPTYDDPKKAARSKALLGVFGFDYRLALFLEAGGANAKLARGFLAHEGRLIAVKGSRAEEEIEVAGHALERSGMEVVTVTELGGQSRGVVLRAAGPVPEGIPRRAGVPQKRPL